MTLPRAAQPTGPDDAAAEPRAPDPDGPAADDPVDTWGMQSFPASDPPQWWAGPPD